MRTRADEVIEDLREWVRNTDDADLAGILERAAHVLDGLQADYMTLGVDLAITQAKLERCRADRCAACRAKDE